MLLIYVDGFCFVSQQIANVIQSNDQAIRVRFGQRSLINPDRANRKSFQSACDCQNGNRVEYLLLNSHETSKTLEHFQQLLCSMGVASFAVLYRFKMPNTSIK